jgi:hypothetical protein
VVEEISDHSGEALLEACGGKGRDAFVLLLQLDSGFLEDSTG